MQPPHGPTHRQGPATTPQAGAQGTPQAGPSAVGRPWIGVRFTCAGAYVRAYRAPSAACYVARCPRCGLACRFPVGPGGTSQRLFDASCR